MAYVPPHKRHSTAPLSQSNQTLTLTPKSKHKHRNRKYMYASNPWPRWFIPGDSVPIRLVPFDCEEVEQKHGCKPVVVVREEGGGGVEDEVAWVRKIGESVGNELVESWKGVGEAEEEVVGVGSKLSFLARLGKVLILGNRVHLDAVRRAAGAEADSRKQVNKMFYTNISDTYVDDFQHIVVPNTGFEFDSEKEHYHVQIELDQLRHLLVDVSCLYKDQDLRFMLSTHRIVKTMGIEENDGITKLIRSAVIDPDVKGGLRWPLGKETVGDRFSVGGVWHTKYKSFKNKTMMVKLRHADRFDHRASVGQVSTELAFRLTGISEHLRGRNTDQDVIKLMVQEAVTFIWDHFLSTKHPSS